MKRKIKKPQKMVKGMSSAVVLSILIHAGLFLLAGMLVVFTVVKKEEQKFEPPKAVDRPKMKLKKPKVKVKKTSKPKPTTRIVTKLNRASMPDIQLPEMSGMGDGLSGGIGGFDMMPDFNEVSVMGSGQSIGNDLEGRFYDFKRDRAGRDIPYSKDMYRDIARKFLKSGWKTSTLARYYQSPRTLYATTIVIPPVLSEIAPAAFGEAETEGNFWMAHYKGQLVHKDGITFRFMASGDELVAVRVDGKVVIAVSWPSIEGGFIGDIWQTSSADSRKYWMGNNTAVAGDWITLEPGVSLDMEVALADNGGEACLMLAIQEKGVEYPMRTSGGPTFPAFKTAMPSHELQDAIYKNMVAGELNLTNGPIFCDYDVVDIVETHTPKQIDAPVEPASSLRTWTRSDGKTIEAEFLVAIGGKAVLKMPNGKQKKLSIEQLSAEDREYIELANPPEFNIDFDGQTRQVFSIVKGGPSGKTVAYDYRAKVKLKQESAGAYNHELDIEFFAIGEEIYGDRYILLDRQKSSFTPNAENGKFHEFKGRSVELANFTIHSIHRGERPGGHLVTVTDSRGIIVQQAASSKWLAENLTNLKRLPVGAYMDKTCTRVFPTNPPRTKY